MMAAMRVGAGILRDNGSALEAVVATIAALEDHPLFNAGSGSLLNSEGNVEMDASVMFAEPVPPEDDSWRQTLRSNHSHEADYTVSAGAVAVVGRVRNPIMLARAVMEHSPHMLMAGAGAENFARKVGIRMVRPEEMMTERARERWRARRQQRMLDAQAAARAALGGHGTVGAVAVDLRRRNRGRDLDRRRSRQNLRTRRRLRADRRGHLRARFRRAHPRPGRARRSS